MQNMAPKPGGVYRVTPSLVSDQIEHMFTIAKKRQTRISMPIGTSSAVRTASSTSAPPLVLFDLLREMLDKVVQNFVHRDQFDSLRHMPAEHLSVSVSKNVLNRDR